MSDATQQPLDLPELTPVRPAHRSIAVATGSSLGRFNTTPMAPSSLCSSMNTTVRAKFGSSRAGVATNSRPRIEPSGPVAS